MDQSGRNRHSGVAYWGHLHHSPLQLSHARIVAPGASAIANGIAQILLRTEDKLADGRTAQAKAIFEGLQKGTIDRSLTLHIERDLLHR